MADVIGFTVSVLGLVVTVVLVLLVAVAALKALFGGGSQQRPPIPIPPCACPPEQVVGVGRVEGGHSTACIRERGRIIREYRRTHRR